jgi:hypothetical protein
VVGSTVDLEMESLGASPRTCDWPRGKRPQRGLSTIGGTARGGNSATSVAGPSPRFINRMSPTRKEGHDGPAAPRRCASGANCVSYPSLGEPSKLSHGNPGARCFACEMRRADCEVDAATANLKDAKHPQVKRTSPSKDYEPKVRSDRPTTKGADAAAVGHQHAEVTYASAIWERRRASVLTCNRGLQSALASGDARLTRRWSKLVRDAEARLVWAESDLEASQKRGPSEQRR